MRTLKRFCLLIKVLSKLAIVSILFFPIVILKGNDKANDFADRFMGDFPEELN